MARYPSPPVAPVLSCPVPRLPTPGSGHGWPLATLALAALLLLDSLATAPPPRPTAGALRVAVAGPPLFTTHGPRFAPTGAAAATPAPDQVIAALGTAPPRVRDRARERYLGADDLYALLHEMLPDAAAGERASQYHVYLTLGQCQTWLRMDPAEAQALNERVLLAMNDRPAEERLQWQAEYQRCRGFAGGDLAPLRQAMGADTPGSEVEYASIWFQRAAAAGYPPALAEAALRINLLQPEERTAMLQEAVQGGDPDVFWQLFLNSPGEGGDPVSPAGMAWLILACRSGQDCSAGAEWFRGAVCLQDGAGCTPGETAVEHYWYSLPEADREAAFALSVRMRRDLAEGRVQGLPWPALANRNIYENRFAQAADLRLTTSIR